MTYSISAELLQSINLYGKLIGFTLVFLAFLICLVHFLKLLSTPDFKKRYDYINMNEVKYLSYSQYFMLVGLLLVSNTFFDSSDWLWFSVRLFITGMLAIIFGVVLRNVLIFYYPFYIEKRLKKLRYAPRVSPEGRRMKLLSEEEEDVYLDEGMQAEEDAFSVDYDVWIDEVNGFTKIEKYNGRLRALQCPDCNYQTLKVDREEIIHPACESYEGELMKYYKCGYCGYKERKPFTIAKTNVGENL